MILVLIKPGNTIPHQEAIEEAVTLPDTGLSFDMSPCTHIILCHRSVRGLGLVLFHTLATSSPLQLQETRPERFNENAQLSLPFQQLVNPE